jgi:hypothetical protein
MTHVQLFLSNKYGGQKGKGWQFLKVLTEKKICQ